jgi:hypothetical protein
MGGGGPMQGGPGHMQVGMQRGPQYDDRGGGGGGYTDKHKLTHDREREGERKREISP